MKKNGFMTAAKGAFPAILAMIVMLSACGANTAQPTSQEDNAPVAENANAVTEDNAMENVEQGLSAPVNYGTMTDTSIRMEELVLTDEWDKVFPQSDEVNHRKVTFVNHFGITLAADLYEPKEYDGKLPAIAVCGPYSAVKEQVSGRYAQEMARRGFLTIAFDPSYYGESGGYPRYFNAPDVNVEDFQAAVDFLSVQDNVDPEKVGIIGICGWGGYGIQTAALDTRIKATAIITMYDMSRVMAYGYNDSTDEDGRYTMRESYNNQRTEDYRNGEYTLLGGHPDEITDDMPQFQKDYIDFYKTERGYHPRSLGSNNGFAATTIGSLMNMHLLDYAPEIRTPVLLIHGENAHSRYFSETAYEILTSGNYADNKELMIIPGAVHCDLYDKMDVIPFDKLEEFFTTNLGK